MFIKLLFSLFLFIAFSSADADLGQAVAYAKAGDVRKGQIELYNISQRALEGQPKSMCEFGTMYKKEGYWIVQSDKDASDWWLKSAEMGYAPCQFNIGAAYLIGSGIEKDLSKAKYWLQRAIDSTYDEFSESARVLYAIHELEKY